jgi:hypothetical protein
MGGEDLFGGLEERVRGEPVAFGQGWEDRLGEGDDFVEELDVCCAPGLPVLTAGKGKE